MRTILIALVLLLAPAGAALADNDIGCGVGTQVFEGQKGLAPHILAMITNGFTFQSISVTFGLLNCDGRDTVTADAQIRSFASMNIDRLSREMATGGGDALDALAWLYGVEQSDTALFARTVQRHYDELFADATTTSDEMLAALDRVLAAQSELARYARS